MLLCAGVVVVVLGVLWVTVPWFVVGGGGGGVSRGGLVAWVFLVLVPGGLRVGVRWFRACHSWLVFGRPGPGGVGCPWCWDIPFGCPWVCGDSCCFGFGLG